MDNFLCLTAHGYENLNKENTNDSVDLIDVCETLCWELSNSLKIAKKFQEELKKVKLEKEALGVCLDESNELNVILKKHFAFEVEKNKSL